MPTDAELVARCLDGDEEAYRALVLRYQDGLYRYALRMVGSPDAAEDMVQLTLIKAYRSLGRCREPDRFGSWVFRILSNRCKDYLKSRQGRETAIPEDWPDPGGDPSEGAERADLLRRVQHALLELPPAQREAFVLKHVEGLSYEEIAERLDVSIGSLKMRVFRAREALRELLGGAW